MLKLEAARKLLDQSAILVRDGEAYMVVDQMTDGP